MFFQNFSGIMSFYQKVEGFFVISTIYHYIVKQYSIYDKSLKL